MLGKCQLVAVSGDCADVTQTLGLAALALPIFIILAAQTLVMALFAMFVTFRVMGGNYDAAVLAAGHCGFGLGATPTAIANMQAVTQLTDLHR